MLAAVASVWLVAWLVLATRHEAQFAHVFDPQAGEMRHADTAIGEHTGDASDYHALSTSDGDRGACSICAALHQATHPVPSHTMLVGAVEGARLASSIASDIAITCGDVYRFAPKTSPPVFA